jgi:hypothetical protein
MKRHIVVFVTFVVGLFFLAEYILPASIWGMPNFLTPLQGKVADAIYSLTIFSLGLGWASMLAMQWRRMTKSKEGRVPGIFFFLSVIGTLGFGFCAQELKKAHPDDWEKIYPWAAQGWSYFQVHLFGALESTVFGLLAFFILSAAFRAFRLRSLDATLLMISAVIIMAAQVPLGQALTAGLDPNFQTTTWKEWMQERISNPATRSLNFGVAIGALAMALRLWLSLERGTFFEKEL